ncbi:MAG: oxygenase MpaB family protein [Nocardioidaceae bacterium]
MWGRDANLHRIARLDPAQDHDEIFALVTRYEFPWEYVQGTSLAFLRDFAVPSISGLLDRTGEFEHRGQKRYDDTILIGFEATVDTLESERGRAAIRHLNRIHRRHDISDDEFVYVLATTIVGPKRFIDAYGRRALHPHETAAMARVTSRFGELMGIKHLPASYPDYEAFLDRHEAEHFRFAPENRRVAEASLRIVAGWYPRPLRSLVRRIGIAMLDEPLRRALGLPRQPRWLGRLVHVALRSRARALRLMPPRPATRPYRHDPSRTYPLGYTLADLGPAGGPR